MLMPKIPTSEKQIFEKNLSYKYLLFIYTLNHVRFTSKTSSTTGKVILIITRFAVINGHKFNWPETQEDKHLIFTEILNQVRGI